MWDTGIHLKVPFDLLSNFITHARNPFWIGARTARLSCHALSHLPLYRAGDRPPQPAQHISSTPCIVFGLLMPLCQSVPEACMIGRSSFELTIQCPLLYGAGPGKCYSPARSLPLDLRAKVPGACVLNSIHRRRYPSRAWPGRDSTTHFGGHSFPLFGHFFSWPHAEPPLQSERTSLLRIGFQTYNVRYASGIRYWRLAARCEATATPYYLPQFVG
jgi:hypothetical protein